MEKTAAESQTIAPSNISEPLPEVTETTSEIKVANPMGLLDGNEANAYHVSPPEPSTTEEISITRSTETTSSISTTELKVDESLLSRDLEFTSTTKEVPQLTTDDTTVAPKQNILTDVPDLASSNKSDEQSLTNEGVDTTTIYYEDRHKAVTYETVSDSTTENSITTNQKENRTSMELTATDTPKLIMTDLYAESSSTATANGYMPQTTTSVLVETSDVSSQPLAQPDEKYTTSANCPEETSQTSDKMSSNEERVTEQGMTVETPSTKSPEIVTPTVESISIDVDANSSITTSDINVESSVFTESTVTTSTEDQQSSKVQTETTTIIGSSTTEEATVVNFKEQTAPIPTTAETATETTSASSEKALQGTDGTVTEQLKTTDNAEDITKPTGIEVMSSADGSDQNILPDSSPVGQSDNTQSFETVEQTTTTISGAEKPLETTTYSELVTSSVTDMTERPNTLHSAESPSSYQTPVPDTVVQNNDHELTTSTILRLAEQLSDGSTLRHLDISTGQPEVELIPTSTKETEAQPLSSVSATADSQTSEPISVERGTNVPEPSEVVEKITSTTEILSTTSTEASTTSNQLDPISSTIAKSEAVVSTATSEQSTPDSISATQSNGVSSTTEDECIEDCDDYPEARLEEGKRNITLHWPLLLKLHADKECVNRKGETVGCVQVVNITDLLQEAIGTDEDIYITAVQLASVETYLKIIDLDLLGPKTKKDFLETLATHLKLTLHVTQQSTKPVSVLSICNSRLSRAMSYISRDKRGLMAKKDKNLDETLRTAVQLTNLLLQPNL